ncbi:hypothetical protein D3C83_185970 [compost metagenome]
MRLELGRAPRHHVGVDLPADGRDGVEVARLEVAEREHGQPAAQVSDTISTIFFTSADAWLS